MQDGYIEVGLVDVEGDALVDGRDGACVDSHLCVSRSN